MLTFSVVHCFLGQAINLGNTDHGGLAGGIHGNKRIDELLGTILPYPHTHEHTHEHTHMHNLGCFMHFNESSKVVAHVQYCQFIMWMF